MLILIRLRALDLEDNSKEVVVIKCMMEELGINNNLLKHKKIIIRMIAIVK